MVIMTQGKCSVLFLQIIDFLPSNSTNLPPYVNCTILVSNDYIYVVLTACIRVNESEVLHTI